VLAGGTMQPVDAVAAQLFGHLPSHRLHLFSCGHIIPRDHLLPLAVARAPSGAPWDFRFASRRSPAQMDELGRALLNLASLVPAGIVVFLPSYDFERSLLEQWAKPAAAAAAGAAGEGAPLPLPAAAGGGGGGPPPPQRQLPPKAAATPTSKQLGGGTGRPPALVITSSDFSRTWPPVITTSSPPPPGSAAASASVSTSVA